jgi:hypothetical protein
MMYSQAFAPFHTFEVGIPQTNQWIIVCLPYLHVFLGHKNLMPNNLCYSSLLPPHQQSTSFFHVEQTKRWWQDFSNSFSPGNRTWTTCEFINLNYLPNGKNFGCHTSLLCSEVRKAKKNGKFWCETRIVCIRMNILPNHGII